TRIFFHNLMREFFCLVAQFVESPVHATVIGDDMGFQPRTIDKLVQIFKLRHTAPHYAKTFHEGSYLAFSSLRRENVCPLITGNVYTHLFAIWDNELKIV